MSSTIKWIKYVKDISYKKPFRFFPHSLHLFLPVKFIVFFATEIWWAMYDF